MVLSNLTYEQFTSVSQSLGFIIATAVVWFLPLLVAILIGIFRGAKTSKGRRIGKRMIQTSGFWFLWILFFLFQAGLFLVLIIFPTWLKLI